MSLNLEKVHHNFRSKLEALSREDLLEIIEKQSIDRIKGINRVEWVFRNKLSHLNWRDGDPVLENDLTKKELALLVDVPFEYSEELAKLGLDENKQRDLHIASDPVLWAEKFLKVKLRVYQIIILRDPNAFKVLRAGRRLGKSFTMAVALLWYSYVTNTGRSLVVTPMKAQASLIYDECLKLAKQGGVVESSIIRHVTSPNPTVEFSNGSTIRFFTSGMKSAGKADVTRGQEAHFIVLDELDYMGEDDMDALLAMLQKTDENQPDKRLMAASTPSGRRAKLWEWDMSPRFSSFWYPSYCFSPETKITMSDGTFKDIENIEVDDMVLTESGPQRVSRTFSRPFSGIVQRLKWYGNSDGITVTGNHPFAASKYGKREDIVWEWVEAKMLEPGRKGKSNSRHWLRGIFDKEVNTCYDFDITKLNKNFKIFDDRIVFERDYVPDYDKNIKDTFPSYLPINDPAFATLVGWYMAEGRVEDYSDEYGCHQVVGWTINSGEGEYIELIQSCLTELGIGDLTITRREDSKTALLRVDNCILAEVLKHLCGVAPSAKKLSTELMQAPYSFQDIMIRVYCNGYGHEITRSDYGIRTSSEQLAKQMQSLISRLGYPYPSIYKSYLTEKGKISKEYGIKPFWTIDFNTNMRHQFGKMSLENGEYALLLRGNQGIEYNGIVYNFEVEKTNSYIANGLLVHNCNPFWNVEQEAYFRDFYTDTGYRHEIEADWGEDADGVYPRRYVDKCFVNEGEGWDYIMPLDGKYNSVNSFTVFGVDWDKFGAGTSIVILEVFPSDYEDKSLAGRIKLIYREETPREEYTLTNSVDRIIYLNSIYNPEFIYVDRGYGDVQVEMMKKHGIANPASGLSSKLVGVSFASSVEIPDPYTGKKDKKPIKPFMVDTLRQYLERQTIMFSPKDEELYLQLISYVVSSVTESGRPKFEMTGSIGDHCHDALILATHAIRDNFDELMHYKSTNYVRTVNSAILNPLLSLVSTTEEKAPSMEMPDRGSSESPTAISRSNIARVSRRKSSISRRSF